MPCAVIAGKMPAVDHADRQIKKWHHRAVIICSIRMTRVFNDWTVIDDASRIKGFGLDLYHCRDARAFTPFSEFPNLGPAFPEGAIGDYASDCVKLAPS